MRLALLRTGRMNEPRLGRVARRGRLGFRQVALELPGEPFSNVKGVEDVGAQRR